MPGTPLPGEVIVPSPSVVSEEPEAREPDAHAVKCKPGRQAPRAVIRGSVPRVVQARHLHGRAAVRGVDEPPVADVHSDMTDGVEEDEIAGTERLSRYAHPEPEVAVRAVGESEPEVGVDEAHQA